MIYFIAFIIVYFLHVLLKLNLYITVSLMIFALIVIPKHRSRYKQEQENKQRFYEVSLYLDSILYAFVKEEKVVPAVQDVCHTLPEGHLKDLVSKALDYMMLTFDEVEVMEDAFRMIDREYPCKRICDVHKFMTHVEYYGGEIEKPVSLLLSDKSRWEKRIKEAIADYKKHFTNVILSVIASLFICGAIIYLPIMNMDISQEWILQICTFFVIVADDAVILRAQKYMARDWLSLQLTEDDDYYEKKMQGFLQYDEKKEKRNSYLLGLIGGLGVMLAALMENEWIVVGALLLTLVFVNQHRIGRSLMKKKLSTAVKYAFPNWLLDLVLLLQSENVQVALLKSREFVPGVLKGELQQLTERLELEPESSVPYHKFLLAFDIPEIHSAMGSLYSLSIGNSGNADRQIGELVDKNLEMLDITEKGMLKNSVSGLYVLFLIPVLTASFKLVIDMVMLMLQFLQTPIL